MKIEKISLETLSYIPNRIVGYFVEANYWHLTVWLLGADGNLVKFVSEETLVAPRFYVHCLKVEEHPSSPPQWHMLEDKFDVVEISLLWRDEWIEKGADGSTLGDDPYTQYFGKLGTVTDQALAYAASLAGIMLRSHDGYQIAVVCSCLVPLNVDIVFAGPKLDALLCEHTEMPVIG